MKKAILLAVAALGINASVFAQERTVTVGGAPMYPSKTIVDNAVNSKEHTTLVAAVKAADLIPTLQGDGPFTVFAPTNKAFNMLPKGTVEGLLKPEAKAQLTGVLTYHVVAGRIDAAELGKMITEQGGKATLTTVAGGKLYASKDKKGHIWIWDENGGKAMITTQDVYQKNGVIHVVDHVLLPKA